MFVITLFSLQLTWQLCSLKIDFEVHLSCADLLKQDFCCLFSRRRSTSGASVCVHVPTAHTQIESLIIIRSQAGNETVKTQSTMTHKYNIRFDEFACVFDMSQSVCSSVRLHKSRHTLTLCDFGTAFPPVCKYADVFAHVLLGDLPCLPSAPPYQDKWQQSGWQSFFHRSQKATLPRNTWQTLCPLPDASTFGCFCNMPLVNHYLPSPLLHTGPTDLLKQKAQTNGF